MNADKDIPNNNNNWLIVVAITFLVFTLSVVCLLLTGGNEPYAALWFAAAVLRGAGLPRTWTNGIGCTYLQTYRPGDQEIFR